MLIVNWRGWARQVVDLVRLDIERKGHIVAHKFETRVVVEMLYIAFGAGEQVVDAQDFMSHLEQTIDQMRTQKSGAASDQNTFTTFIDAWHVQ
jgi:hypothetical protein